jgi:hypothetical protein
MADRSARRRITAVAADLARREGDALSQIVGTGDTRAALEQLERNVKDIIDVARERGFVRSYGDSPHEFYGMPAWQLLGMTYGLVPFVEWTKPVDNGWEARAVVKTRDGAEVSAAEAMCTRTEGNRRNANDHTLRAMAQTRAQRNALRGALGAALVLAGFDFSDPDAPATREQVGALHQLERDLGWSHDEGHEVAGVDSYKNLTREQASELIEQWTKLRDDIEDVKRRGSVVPEARPGTGPGEPPYKGPGTGDVKGGNTRLSGGSSPNVKDRGQNPSAKAADDPSDVGEPEPQPVGEGRGKAQAPDTCSHPSWKRSEGVLRCTACGVPKSEI